MNDKWPPQYILKKHPLARRVKLRVSPRRGLELITPLRFNQKRIPQILEENRVWILKQLAQLQTIQTTSANDFPEIVFLAALNERWHIVYVQSTSPLKLITRPHHQLVITGNLINHEACFQLLIKWIKKKAKEYLVSQLMTVSDKLQLPITKATVRNQHTRWGSCSSKGAISLNYKLIFLPEYLVEHTIIHELCHTVHLNHSADFWKLVARYDNNWQQHRKELRKANHYIPMWLDRLNS